MGTTLTGTTPQTTYDSLIKVTDNGPLSGSLKTLTDGLGNDSALALSTGAASVTGTLAVSSNLTVDTNTLFVDAANNQVGIGTSSLFGKFNLADASNARLEATPVADGVSFEVLDSARANPLDFKVFANDITFNTKVSGSYTERMRVDSAGNCGIGTSSPAQKLDVRGSSGTIIQAKDSASYCGLVIDSGAASTPFTRLSVNAVGKFEMGYFNNLYYLNNNTGVDDTGAAMVITSAGLVGIGTSSPSELLHLSTTLGGSSGVGTAIQITSGGAGGDQAFIGVNKGTGNGLEISVENRDIIFNTGALTPFGGTERMRITSSGNVGIGTDSPSSAGVGYTGLDVRGSSGGSIRYGVSGGINMLTYATGSDVDFVTSAAANIRFFNQAASAESMRITSAGNVGIGTSSPTSKLVVNGDIATSGNIALTGSGAGIFLGGSIGSANGLDDYEEGTFSPTVVGTSTAGTATYTQQHGRYTKIGRLVQFEVYLVWASGTGTGNLQFTGLPFTIGGLSYPSFAIGAIDGVTMSADSYAMSWGNIGTNNIIVNQMVTGGGTQAVIPYDAAGGIQVSGTYSV